MLRWTTKPCRRPERSELIRVGEFVMILCMISSPFIVGSGVGLPLVFLPPLVVCKYASIMHHMIEGVILYECHKVREVVGIGDRQIS
jgi:hypothetical protein